MNKKVLLIEDEDELRENLQEILEISEFEVFTASNGQEGLEIAEDIEMDAIISDMMMPVMDGITFLKNIKLKEKYVYVPVIILTAKIDKIAYRTGMESGADDFLTKPIKANELLSALNSAISNSEIKKKVIHKQLEQALHLDRNVRYHELRTPLFGVISTLDLLLDPKISLTKDEELALLKSSSQSAKRLNKSLQKISLFQHLDSEKEMKEDLIDCFSFISKILLNDDFKDLEFEFKQNEYQFFINFPFKKIEFIFNELIYNALAFGQGKLTFSFNPSKKSIIVTNNQKVISQPTYIFPEPFRHFSDGYNEKSGIGLGLYISKEYLNQHGKSMLIQVNADLNFEVEIFFNS